MRKMICGFSRCRIMSRPPRDPRDTRNGTYFVTSSTAGKRRLLQSDAMATLLIEVLYKYRQATQYLLHEFVIMPNHVHLILTTPADITLERAMQFIKGNSSFRAGKELGLSLGMWQRGFGDHRILNAPDFRRHRDYVRNNPVKASLVQTADQYPFSSAWPTREVDPPPIHLRG